MVRRYAIVLALLFFPIAGLIWWWAATGVSTSDPQPDAGAISTDKKNASSAPVGSTGAPRLDRARALVLERLAYAQLWDNPLPPAMQAFHDWAERYRVATIAERAAMEREGVELAHARRPEMLQMIRRDPQHALAVTVPAVVRQILPAEILAELENRVAGRGDYATVAGISQPGRENTAPARRRTAFINGASYAAHVYGRREAQLTKVDASLHGVAIDRDLALHESPLRAFEPGEELASAPSGEMHCPISGRSVALPAAGTPVNTGTIAVGEAFGRIWGFCDVSPDMLALFEQGLVSAEDVVDPRVQLPGVAALTTTSRTSGTQRVLVIRVDFSDLAGAPVIASDAQTTMDTVVKPFLENASYSTTTIATTVSTNVYRMPQTAAAYASAGNDDQLHADARTAAAANYTLANYDRLVVAFANLGGLSGSKITYGGLADVAGPYVWINGFFTLRTLSHELGHTYGLEHSNVWLPAGSDPVDATGRSMEYYDPFDPMGSGSTDTRFDYNSVEKNRLGWLPDAKVYTVTTSGRYRIARFDHPGALAFNEALALRIYRDGMRWYWVSFRQNFTTNSSLNNGACVTWGFNNLQQTQLLDVQRVLSASASTPNTSFAGGLTVGQTLTDSKYGVTIKVVAKGGTAPVQYLDIDVTVPSPPPVSVNAWGHEVTLFYDATTGAAIDSPPETFVPANLGNVTAIAAGDIHAVALKSDGTIAAWGDNTNGQTTIPSGASTNITAIAAGGNVTGVVKNDGTVQLWGESSSGATSPPVGLTGVRQLAIGGKHSSGFYHALALKTDGTVVAWGSNSNGQTSVPAGLNNVIAVVAGDRGSAALKSDGTVVRWGITFTSGVVPFPPGGLTGVKVIASSGAAQHFLALKTDGTVAAWGNNIDGEAIPPGGLSNVVAIATGGFTSMALKADGTVVTWGYGGYGQLYNPQDLPRSFAVAGGLRASFALSGAHAYILSEPQSQSVGTGSQAILSVGAVGSGSLSYQWKKDGANIAGATSSVYVVNNAQPGDAGQYSVTITDSTGSITSNTISLSVSGTSTANSRLYALSCRAVVGTGGVF